MAISSEKYSILVSSLKKQKLVNKIDIVVLAQYLIIENAAFSSP